MVGPGNVNTCAAIALEMTRGAIDTAAVAIIMAAATIIVFVFIKDYYKNVL
jgi:hypothetical protein